MNCKLQIGCLRDTTIRNVTIFCEAIQYEIANELIWADSNTRKSSFIESSKMIEKFDWNKRTVPNLDSDWREYSMILQEKEGQIVFISSKAT